MDGDARNIRTAAAGVAEANALRALLLTLLTSGRYARRGRWLLALSRGLRPGTSVKALTDDLLSDAWALFNDPVRAAARLERCERQGVAAGDPETVLRNWLRALRRKAARRARGDRGEAARVWGQRESEIERFVPARAWSGWDGGAA